MSVDVQVYDLNSIRPKKIRAVIVQLNSVAADWENQDSLFALTDANSFDDAIADAISNARQNTADLLVFPELGVPDHCVESLRIWSAETGGVVVAGSHYYTVESGAISRSPVIIGGEIHFTEKQTPSPHEVSPIHGQGVVSGSKLYVFKNSPIGTFAVLICSDYLDSDVRTAVTNHDLDLLCVPAFQNNSVTYHERMQLDVLDSASGLYVLYANMLCPSSGHGRSAVFGQMDTLFASRFEVAGLTDLNPSTKSLEFADKTRSLTVELDLENKRPSLPRRVNSRPNINLLDQSTCNKEESGRFVSAIAHDDERYRRIKELFVPPDEYAQIVDTLEKSKLVFITGDPGIGKTYTAAHLLHRYFEMGYMPTWYTGLEREERKVQRQVLEGFEPRAKDVIYFEDPFGRTAFERRDAIFTIFGPLIDRLSQVDARVIITSRRDVFEVFSRESLTGQELEAFRTEMSIQNPSYSIDSLQRIMLQLANGRCMWWASDACRQVACDAVTSEEIATPITIRDFVLSSVEISEATELQRQIERRRKETARAFAFEIRECDILSRLSLLMVYVFGTLHQITISNHYARCIDGLAGYSIRPTKFIEQLRLHLGYRVEQFGSHVRGFRFSHPMYEEAFVEAVQSDNELVPLVANLVQNSTSEQIRHFVAGVLRNAKKQPNFSAQLIETATAQIVQVEDSMLSLDIAQRLVGAYDVTREPQFLHLLNQVVSLPQVIDFINETNSTRRANRALQVAVNLLRLDGKEREGIDHQIDWPRLIAVISQAGIHPRLMFLERAREVRHAFVAEYLDQSSDAQLLRDLARVPSHALKNQVLEQFVSTFSSARADRLAEQALNLSESGRDWSKWMAELAREIPLGTGIMIDKGAYDAMKAGRSLLPVGICGVNGDFDDDCPTGLLNNEGGFIGYGIPQYTSSEIDRIRGHHSGQIIELCGRFRGVSVIRRSCFRFTTEYSMASHGS